jgi:hypothetical protein
MKRKILIYCLKQKTANFRYCGNRLLKQERNVIAGEMNIARLYTCQTTKEFLSLSNRTNGQELIHVKWDFHVEVADIFM